MSSDRLTFFDVQDILAVLDAWPQGHVRLRRGDLDAHVVLAAPTELTSDRPQATAVTATLVGVFNYESGLEAGSAITSESILGTIAAPGRTGIIRSSKRGRFLRYTVPDGTFVEYGQPVALVEPHLTNVS